MTDTNKTPGFYGNDNDTCYMAPSGRIWLVASVDELQSFRELHELPEDCISLDGMLTPEECIDYCRQIEEESGEKLIEED